MPRKKKKAKKSRTITTKRSRSGEMWLSLGVETLATDDAFRKAVQRHLISMGDWNAPRKKRHNGKSQSTYDAIYEPVKATIEIDAYLTKDVPERMRKRTFKIRCEGDALCRAADMYLQIFRENEKRGGDPALATAADVAKRVSKRKAKNGGVLCNRGSEPYVWGHDLSDLVFERIYVEWKNKRECRITFGVGS